ncbi:Uma2 family endonuclease [Leptolyngbya sp. 'hensonii']|uniref:Uma2 family endonuclease n=1 Tax=Leptolyngbya sp. 'hensonii' TaxID=1922337 RepID=UPI0025B75CF4|nr:Uma2 family endonuclease [Leptolyngbya sp. 'hensonii']
MLAPDQNQNRVTGNILHYLNFGCPSGWLIDPESRSLLIYLPHQQPLFFEAVQEVLPIPDQMADFHLTVGELFGWLQL